MQSRNRRLGQDRADFVVYLVAVEVGAGFFFCFFFALALAFFSAFVVVAEFVFVAFGASAAAFGAVAADDVIGVAELGVAAGAGAWAMAVKAKVLARRAIRSLVIRCSSMGWW